MVACAAGRPRLFLFSRREPADTEEVATGRYGGERQLGGSAKNGLVVVHWLCLPVFLAASAA